MNALLILLVAAVILVIGYVCYGGWLAKQWGVDPKRPTPAHELEDGVDYVPAPPYVVLGHHFSSIAGAGPINGPIQAAVFGWVPVLLWVLIGGIFFGAMHDFGSLFASLRHKGQTLAVVVAENIDNTAKKLFCIFAYLTLLLVVAAFASIVANTFAVSATAAAASNLANEQTAMISIIFIGVAVVYGFLTRGRNIPGPVNIVTAIILIIIMVAIGYNLPLMGISLALDYNTWMIILGVYILIACTANLAGAHGVIIPKRRAVGLTATVAKTSAGALNYTPVAKVTNLTATMEDLKKRGLWFVCADMGGDVMYKMNLTGPIGLVIGNEGEGVSKLVKEHCDMVASIPMKGDIDSLNASVAAGVLAYEIVRQRLAKQ